MDKHTEEMMKRARESFDKMMEKSTPAQRQDAAFKAMYGASMLHEPTMVKADRKHLDQLSGPVFSDLQSMRVAESEDEIAHLRAELNTLRQLVKDTCEDMECEPSCDSIAHSESCPVANPAYAWRKLRAELEAAKGEVEALRVGAERYREDSERLEFVYSDAKCATDDLLNIEFNMIQGKYPTIDEARQAIDAARGKDNG